MAYLVQGSKKQRASIKLPQLHITRSIILIVSFTLYYFFAGIAMVLGRKIPKEYKVPTRDVVDVAFREVEKKQKGNTSKVVDLDYTPPPINLMKD